MKTRSPSRLIKAILGIIVILYPLLVFLSLVVFKLPVRYLSILILIFAIGYIYFNRKNFRKKNAILLFVTPFILCVIGIICLVTESRIILKIYPALADLAYLSILTTSLLMPPSIVYYFIDLFDKSIHDKLPKDRFIRYCRNATILWCVFFLIDGIISTTLNLRASDTAWGIYSGGITYMLMGLIFIGEFVVLRIIIKKESRIIRQETNNEYS
jgi:uncharacterized membrane protein